MTDQTAAATAWERYAIYTAWPALASQLPNFVRFSLVEKISLSAHWTDITNNLDDPSVKSDAESGIPSPYVIAWAIKHRVSERELRHCYRRLNEIYAEDAPTLLEGSSRAQ